MEFISIEQLKEDFIKGKYSNGIYSSKNEKDEDIVVIINSNSFSIMTNQSNGWVRVCDYDYDSKDETFTFTESYDGKWK